MPVQLLTQIKSVKPSSLWNSLLLKRLTSALAHIRYGSVCVTTPEGESLFFQGSKPGVTAHMVIADWRTLVLFASKGDIGLTQAYRQQWWDSPNLTHLLLFGMQNELALSSWLQGSFFSRLASQCSYALRRNSLRGSARNIEAHYDLSNAFYQLWLDPSMTYSSAIFSHSDESLFDAQNRKYDRLLDRLETGSGSLLEIGCGWGGFAQRSRQRFDFDYTGLTLSKEQLRYAQDRLAKDHVAQKEQFVLRDYRHQQGRFDNIVSIEMFEAVGESYWSTYFKKISALLKEKGRALIQTITIEESRFDRYRSKGDMIRTFIFPGGMLPSTERFTKEAEKAGLVLTDRFDFGLDYAKTIEHWLNRFEKNVGAISALGFDDAFIRLWRFYLASCIAGFQSERIGVSHLELRHGR